MADEVNAPISVDATSTVDMPTRPADAIVEPAVAEAKPAEDGVVATESVAEAPQASDAQEDVAAKEDTTADAAAPSDDAEVAPATDASATTETPAKKATNGRRKSAASVPEHKKKTPAKKKKAAPELRLDAQPGQMYMVAMRGYQPWPVIIADEEMLPESLLIKRPVSAKRIDGTYREDFLEGGKNAKDRRYPIMFLGTNEFAWQVNSELLTFDLDEVKKDLETNPVKKNKALTEAYRIVAEGHDLAYFKQMLASHEQAMQEDAEQREVKEQQKKEKASKFAKRKSTAAEESDGLDGAAPSAKKAKATKKRKKGDESDEEQTAKTPKTKLKLTNKTPKEASAAKKKEPKSKKKVSEEPAEPEEPPMTAEERIQKREKQVLYLRHRLQKGFLSRDQAPKDEDMSSMSGYLEQLEAHDDLEAEVIKKTKVHKVLKAIMKLESIPKEEVFNFKQRSNDLLHKWGGSLAAESEPAATASAEPTSNGAKPDDEKSESVKAESPAEKKDDERKEADAPTEPTAAEAADNDGDVAMADADKDAESKDALAAPADAAPSTEDGTETKAEPATVDTEMTAA